VADGWLRLVAGGWFVLREKYCWLVADKPSEQANLEIRVVAYPMTKKVVLIRCSSLYLQFGSNKIILIKELGNKINKRKIYYYFNIHSRRRCTKQQSPISCSLN
jgi:hypothetical protein